MGTLIGFIEVPSDIGVLIDVNGSELSVDSGIYFFEPGDPKNKVFPSTVHDMEENFVDDSSDLYKQSDGVFIPPALFGVWSMLFTGMGSLSCCFWRWFLLMKLKSIQFTLLCMLMCLGCSCDCKV